MALRYSRDVAEADWIVRARIPWMQLVGFGPPGFYARLRYIRDPVGPGRTEADANVAEIIRPTSSKHNGRSTIWRASPALPDIATSASGRVSRASTSRRRKWLAIWSPSPGAFRTGGISLCTDRWPTSADGPRLWASMATLLHPPSPGQLTTAGVSPPTWTRTGPESEPKDQPSLHFSKLPGSMWSWRDQPRPSPPTTPIRVQHDQGDLNVTWPRLLERQLAAFCWSRRTTSRRCSSTQETSGPDRLAANAAIAARNSSGV